MRQTSQDPPLPVDSVLQPLLQTLSQGSPLVVLEAPPGTGKTTRVPPACLKLGTGQVWVLEPRRLAARYSARWVAQSLGQSLGQTVGYQVRLDSRCGPETRLIYMTQGVFARHLVENPQLRGVDLVILDEFHERSLDNDLALAWLRAQHSPQTLIMSATLPADLGERLGQVPHLRCSTPLYPVALGYEPHAQISQLLPQTTGSGLVFLPGMREIRRQAEALQGSAQRCAAQVQILHGSLSPEEQDQVLQADPQSRRWVLTTNIAETSLTVPGIRWVVDSGWARYPVQLPGTLGRLETLRISQFSALQRSGRAGRQGPGQCVRLYSHQDFLARPASETPEILRSDLSALALLWLQLGQPELEWLDSPPEAAWQAALTLLQRLGAWDGQALTPLGRSMARLPLDPRLARLLLAFPQPAGARAAAWLSAGGDPTRPDLQRQLSPPNPPGPEERQLQQLARRCPPDFQAPSLEQALLTAFPDRVAQLRRGQDLVLCDGSGYRMASTLMNWHAAEPWLLALQVEIDDPGERRVRLLACQEITPELLLDRPELREEQALDWNEKAGRVEERSTLQYGQLVLEQSRRRARPGPGPAAILARVLPTTPWYRQQQTRLERWHVRHQWALKADPGLQALPDFEAWLEELCLLCTGLDEVQSECWSQSPSPRLRRRLQELCPDTVPLGPRRRVEVHYEAGQPPWIASKLVDFFGLAKGPQLAGGKIPLVLHLLAPNFRPVQITQDLAGFWERHYPKIRQELCRRYPRHPWPEDPLRPQAEEMRPKKRQT